jgi:hypothetical protein
MGKSEGMRVKVWMELMGRENRVRVRLAQVVMRRRIMQVRIVEVLMLTVTGGVLSVLIWGM